MIKSTNVRKAYGKGMRTILSKGSLILLSVIAAKNVQAQCNTMPGINTGDLGCVTFTYQGQPVTYTTVRAADGNVWLQQNLGSVTVATSKTDTAAYGHLFQWGRWDDGHQLRNSATASVPATNNPSGIPANTNTFFTGTSSAAWWNGGQLTDTWSGTTASATNGIDPCKSIGANWHLPTQAEWTNVVADEAIANPDLAFSSNLKLAVSGSRSSSTGGFDFVGTRGYYWSSTTSITGAKYYYYSAATNNTGAGNLRGGGAAVRCINVSGTVSITDSVKVSTQNNVAATITTNTGTLQMAANVYPAIINQDVTWSIVPGTGAAMVNATGLVTAQTNGTVWAKAVSVATPAKSDSLLIIISNQVININSIDVTTSNSLPATITTNAGTLQTQAIILPAAANQNVTWSIVAGTGTATVNTTGLVTAQTNGTVWAKAVSVQDITQSDSLLITISNQVMPPVAIDSVVVKTANNLDPVINTLAGTLQVQAVIYPATANQNITWSIIPASGVASVSASGLITAQQNGSIWVKAISVQDVSKSDSLQINITNQQPTAIQEIGTLEQLTVYPNPATQKVFIGLKGAHTELNIILTDVYGRKISEQYRAAYKSGSIHQVSLHNLSAGLYFIAIKGEGINVVRRVVKK